MDKIVFFHYQHKNSIIHNIDSRIKILIMLLLSVCINLLNNAYGYAVIFAYVVFMLIVSKLPILTLLKNLRMFAAIIVFILVFNCVKIPSLSDISSIHFSYEGLIQGLYYSSKLVLILSLTTAITSTFSLIDFRNTIEWYLSFIKFIPAKRIAMMINMTFIFIPIIFDKYIEIRNAQISRCLNSCKNPIKTIVSISVALINSVIQQSDEMAFAMEARNYTEESSKVQFDKPKASDIIMLICSMIVIVVAGYISYRFKA